MFVQKVTTSFGKAFQLSICLLKKILKDICSCMGIPNTTWCSRDWNNYFYCRAFIVRLFVLSFDFFLTDRNNHVSRIPLRLLFWRITRRFVWVHQMLPWRPGCRCQMQCYRKPDGFSFSYPTVMQREWEWFLSRCTLQERVLFCKWGGWKRFCSAKCSMQPSRAQHTAAAV